MSEYYFSSLENQFENEKRKFTLTKQIYHSTVYLKTQVLFKALV